MDPNSDLRIVSSVTSSVREQRLASYQSQMKNKWMRQECLRINKQAKNALKKRENLKRKKKKLAAAVYAADKNYRQSVTLPVDASYFVFNELVDIQGKKKMAEKYKKKLEERLKRHQKVLMENEADWKELPLVKQYEEKKAAIEKLKMLRDTLFEEKKVKARALQDEFNADVVALAQLVKDQAQIVENNKTIEASENRIALLKIRLAELKAQKAALPNMPSQVEPEVRVELPEPSFAEQAKPVRKAFVYDFPEYEDTFISESQAELTQEMNDSPDLDCSVLSLDQSMDQSQLITTFPKSGPIATSTPISANTLHEEAEERGRQERHLEIRRAATFAREENEGVAKRSRLDTLQEESLVVGNITEDTPTVVENNQLMQSRLQPMITSPSHRVFDEQNYSQSVQRTVIGQYHVPSPSYEPTQQEFSQDKPQQHYNPHFDPRECAPQQLQRYGVQQPMQSQHPVQYEGLSLGPATQSQNATMFGRTAEQQGQKETLLKNAPEYHRQNDAMFGQTAEYQHQDAMFGKTSENKRPNDVVFEKTQKQGQNDVMLEKTALNQGQNQVMMPGQATGNYPHWQGQQQYDSRAQQNPQIHSTNVCPRQQNSPILSVQAPAQSSAPYGMNHQYGQAMGSYHTNNVQNVARPIYPTGPNNALQRGVVAQNINSLDGSYAVENFDSTNSQAQGTIDQEANHSLARYAKSPEPDYSADVGSSPPPARPAAWQANQNQAVSGLFNFGVSEDKTNESMFGSFFKF